MAAKDQVPDNGAEEVQTPEDDADSPPRIRIKGADGEWRDLEVGPKRTGDPELDELWAMPMEELEQILDDTSHPLHDKALQVQREAFEPIIEALAETTKSIAASFANVVDTSGIAEKLLPKIDIQAIYPKVEASSWLADLLPKFEGSEGVTKQLAEFTPIEPPPSLEIPEQRWIDFDSVEPPNASLAEIQEAAEERAHEMRSRQITVLTDLLAETRASAESEEEALEVSKQALRTTQDSVDEARGSKHAAWTAAVVAGVGIIVTLVFNILTLL